MMRKSLLLLVMATMAGFMAACGDPDAEYVELDRDWDASDSAFMVDYDAVRSEYDQLETDYNAMPASDDTAVTARRTEVQTRLQANRQRLQEIESTRAAARQKRDAARTAADRAAYDAARKEADYAAWKADLDRIRAERAELEGMIRIGNNSVGAVDMNVQDTSKPLIRVEPGKEDDKPLIEVNKNP
jgi:chromosome segregation ATPase